MKVFLTREGGSPVPRTEHVQVEVSRGTWWLRMWRAALVWTTALALVVGGLGLVLDGARLWQAGAGLPIVLAGALSAAGLAVMKMPEAS